MPNITLLPSGASPTSGSTESSSNPWLDATPEDVLDDLSSRFILNLPAEEQNVERICFQIEQAHWYYEDFIREANPRFPSLSLKRFTEDMFHHCPSLKEWRLVHESAYEQFMVEKIRVPVCGAIMLNETWDKCILVKGWKQSSGWGFPKGKINQEELRHVCAVREVLEETGYDLSKQINPDHVIEMTIKQQTVSLYIVAGVPEDFPFETKTRKEISKIEWFNLADLPTWKRSKANPGKFYLIAPFIAPLKSFIAQHKPRNKRSKKTASYSPPSDLPSLDSSSIQESSSQSSDPLTPSPQYTEQVPYMTDVPPVQPESLDPHLARLLSGLGGLGANPSNEQDPPKTAQPITGSSTKPSSVAVSVKHHVTLPRHAETQVQSNQSPMLQRPEASPMTSPRQTMASAKSPLVSPSAPSSSTSSVLTPPSVLRSRRTSSTTNISPYLSRPAEVPTTARHLRRLALLESVAKQSEQTPGKPSLSPPSRPQSLAPQNMMYGSDRPILYSSTQPTSQTSFSIQAPQRPYSVMDDPFQVRPRYGAAVPPSIPSSQSLGNSHGQLLSLLSQTPALPPPNVYDQRAMAGSAYSYFPDRTPFSNASFGPPMNVASPNLGMMPAAAYPAFPPPPPPMSVPPALSRPMNTPGNGLLTLLNGGSYTNS